MTRLMAPVLSFTAEEVWQNTRQRAKSEEQRAQDKEESVFLASFPEVNEKYYDLELGKKWGDLFILRNEVNKFLEIKRAERFIGNSLEAKVVLYYPEEYKKVLPPERVRPKFDNRKYKTHISEYNFSEDRDFLPTFFIVSAVEITHARPDDSYKSTEIEGLEVKVEKARGAKCQRCWNWRETVGKSKDAPEICDRCYKVLFE
jgi:isoleucyl-tRNA synthetase